MKKILLIISIIFCHLTFSLNFDEINWHQTKTEIETLKNVVKYGDIIIYKPKYDNIKRMFGHLLFIVEDGKFVDFTPAGFREMPLEELVNDDREFVLIRTKFITKDVQEKMQNMIDNDYLYRKYFVFLPPSITFNASYCSLFIADLYEKTVGTVIDYDYNIIRPLTFLKSKYFNIVEF